MSVKNGSFLLPLLLAWQTIGAIPQPYSQTYPTVRSTPQEDLNSTLRQLKTGLADLKHEMRNHEAEIRIFENKLLSQETSFEHLRQQLTEDVQTQRALVKASNINLEVKAETLDQSIQNLETLVRGLVTDMRQIKLQVNESTATFGQYPLILGQYKQKITDLETVLQTQSQQMQNLEAALQSMLEVWQAKEATQEITHKAILIPEKEVLKTYKVQPGDSLEKIARLYKVTVQALQDSNQLDNDRIIVGQVLKIP